MSSMLRTTFIALFTTSALSASAPLAAQEAVVDAAEWDRARAALVASQPGPMAQAIDRWQQLSASPNFGFGDYSAFILTYPSFPDEAKLRGYAEGRLAKDAVDTDRLIAFFDRYPPLTNPARAQYAVALATKQRPEALATARAAWRGGSMSAATEAMLVSLFGSQFTQDDYDARMDALLWDRDTAAAARTLNSTSASRRSAFAARLTAAQGAYPMPVSEAAREPGYIFNLSRQLRSAGRTQEAVNLLSSRPPLESLPHDQTAWVKELLTVARAGGARAAQRIAASIDDGFEPGTDISNLGYTLRDDYPSLMWLGGTKALWELGEPGNAAPLFYRYGAAARTPQTRSKGFYWAGLAAQRAGDTAGAQRYLEMAAAYPDRFYGMLALERLGRPIPPFNGSPGAVPSSDQRQDFYSRPLTRAGREVARDAPWRVGIRFYREISSRAETEADFVMVADLAREIGRRDLAVILGEEAAAKGIAGFERISFPTMTTPPATNWTMVHAITRQESQFAQNAVSHAGASGLMQLMPGTVKAISRKTGVPLDPRMVASNRNYNVAVGSHHFADLLSRYAGNVTLAAAAYNAGSGASDDWISRFGDPRTNAVDIVDWIELIPFRETRGYVKKVVANYVAYLSTGNSSVTASAQ